jgi:hypothetical protein
MSTAGVVIAGFTPCGQPFTSGFEPFVLSSSYPARSARMAEQDSVFFELQAAIFRQITLSAKPIFHGMLQLSERHMGADFDEAIG